MAYENNVTEVIKDVEKGSRGDVIRVAKVTNTSNGSVSCDVRMFYDEDGELKPTKKGCRFNAESAYDIVEALLEFLTVDELENLASVLGDKLCDDDEELVDPEDSEE